MRIFLAGASGAIGRRLTPLLLAAGHEVTGTTRSADKAEQLKAHGVQPVVVDVFDAGAVRDAGKKAAEFCRSHGADISEVALRFSLGHPYVSSTLVGMANARQVEASLTLLRSSTDPELLRQVEAIVAPVFNYVWPSGRAENQD